VNNSTGPIKPTLPSSLMRLWGNLTRSHPSITNIGARRQAQLTASLSLGLSLLLLIGFVATTIVHAGQISIQIYILVGMLLFSVLIYLLARTRWYRISGSILVWSFVLVGYFLVVSGTDRPVLGLLIAVIPAMVMASILLPIVELIILIVANVIAMILLPFPEIRPYVGGAIGILFTSGGLLVISIVFRNNVERERLNELQIINQELVQTQASLEQRVDERTEELASSSLQAQNRAIQLQTLAEVAQQITQVQDINELLPAITRLMSERLGFYHVGIFLLDEKKEYAVLMASNSTGGQRMLQRGHRLRVGQVGIVGYVAEKSESRISLDVGSDAVFFDNPDLPDTHSEMALPLVIGDHAIGVLDVQSEKISAFIQQDIDVMSTLANQVAVAIENARRFSETRQALAEARTVYSQYLRQAWQETSLEKNAIGYQYSNTLVKPLLNTLDKPEVLSAVNSGLMVVQTEENPTLAIPLKIREEIIGVLNISSKSSNRQWNDNEMALVRAVAERVALALENARLFEETTHRADRERTVTEITTHIRSASDPQKMLQTALDDLKKALGASDIQIRPYTPPSVNKPLDEESSKNKNTQVTE
jgi:GAF domain-containing protein